MRKKKLLYSRVWAILTCVVLSFYLVSGIVIRQVQASPIERVQLENDGDTAVILDGLVIATEASMKDSELKGVIPPGGFFTIGDSGADLIDKISLYNTDSGVALMNGSEILDAVGWGNITGIKTGLWQGTPAQNPKEESLIRVSKNKDNSKDFIISPPDFSSNIIKVNVTVPEIKPPTISSIITSDDSAKTGTQILLVPGSKKSLSVNIMGENLLEVSAEIAGINSQLNVSKNIATGNIDIPFTTPPGNYELTARSGSTTKSINVEILSLISIDVSKRLVNASASDVILATRGIAIDIFPKATNKGNIPLNIKIYRNSIASDRGILNPGETTTIEFDLVPGDVYIVGAVKR